ncbi:MAG: hypothetical protein NTW60_01010 [Candidatus Wolfebacteria bacterium]|nr:hypothetical protein [Candidatus Wolfebacteria bacterium]
MNFRRELIIFASINLGIIFVLGSAIYYLNTLISSETEKVAIDRASIFSRNQMDENLAMLRTQSAAAKKYETSLDNALPKKDQLINFSQDMEIIGKQNGVNANANLAEEVGGTDSKLASLRFNMSLEGTIENILQTLNAIKKSRYVTKAESMELSKSQSNNFRLTTNGQIFSFQNQE